MSDWVDVTDQLPSESSSGGWEDVTDQLPDTPPTPELSTREKLAGLAGALGGGQTGNWIDELAAGLRSGASNLRQSIGLTPNYGDYQSELDAIRAGQGRFDAAYPKASAAENLLGATAFSPLNVVLPSFQGLSRGGRILANALTGAGVSSLYGAGASEGDKGAAAVNAAPAGALLGGGLSALLEGITGAKSAYNTVRDAFSHPEATAARILQDEAGNAGVLDQASQLASKANASSYPGDLTTYPTLAERVNEVSGSPNVALSELQTAISANPAASADMAENLLNREGARRDLFGAVATSVKPEEAGGLVKQAMKELQSGLKESARGKFESIDPSLQIDIQSAIGSTEDKINEIFGSKVEPNSKIVKLVDSLRSSSDLGSNTIPYEDLQPLRSRALTLARQFSRGAEPDAQNAAIASHLADQLDEAVNVAGNKGNIPEDAYQTWKSARADWLKMKQQGKTPVGKILESKNIPPSAVFSKILSTKSGRGQFEIVKNFDELFGDNPQMQDLLQGSAAQDLMKKAVRSEGNITKGKILDWMESNKDLLDYLPGLKATAKNIAKDVTSEQSIKELAKIASRGQSMTAQTLAKGNYVQSKVLQQLGIPAILAKSVNLGAKGGGAVGSAIGAAVGGGVPGTIIGGLGGAAIGGVAQRGEENVIKALAQILMHPETYQAAASHVAPAPVNPALLEAILGRGAASQVRGD